MANPDYDVIIVGARCAGSPTAMLLARQGYRVLVLDRATFPSDTISTHVVHPPAVTALRRWGLLDQLTASGCPPVHTYVFDFGPITISGSPGGEGGVAYCPRRFVLDPILVQAASDAGAEVREGSTVDGVVISDGRVTGVRGHRRGGAQFAESAAIVIGADGLRSAVAEAVGADHYHGKPRLLVGYYSYWSGLPMHGRFETYVRPHRGFAACNTNDGLTVVIAGWPYSEFEANRRDIEGSVRRTMQLAPSFYERLQGATRETRFVGAAVPNYFRKPYGPGWALIGDAGYNKDFITAMGIHDAFRDAELCATAVDQTLSGERSFDDAMADYQAARDREVMPMYEFTTQLATLEPPPEDLQHLLHAMQGNHEAMDAFVRMNAATLSPTEFFSPENVQRILAQADSAQAQSGVRR